MSILIKGMEMPVIDLEWTIRHGADGKWYAIDTNAETSDEEWHEIIPVPPHDGEAFEKVISERITQIAKWGDESRNYPFEWMSILGEEFGELCEAVNETYFRNGTHPERGGNENIIREATQIAAVAITIIRDFAPTIIPASEEDNK